jgi:hypothetical protein
MDCHIMSLTKRGGSTLPSGSTTGWLFQSAAWQAALQ